MRTFSIFTVCLVSIFGLNTSVWAVAPGNSGHDNAGSDIAVNAQGQGQGRGGGNIPPGLDRGDGQGPPGQADRNGEAPGLCRAENDGPPGRSGKSHVAHVNFSMVDPVTGDFTEDETLPWGRMTYFWVGATFDFVFNGHQFVDALGVEYTLTYQPEPMPAPGVICLGSAEVNDEGDIHILNSLELDSNLPPDPADEGGVSLVLVLSGDVDCDTGEMTTWLPDDYLFTTSPVIYVDTDLATE